MSSTKVSSSVSLIVSSTGRDPRHLSCDPTQWQLSERYPPFAARRRGRRVPLPPEYPPLLLDERGGGHTSSDGERYGRSSSGDTKSGRCRTLPVRQTYLMSFWTLLFIA